MSEECYKKRRDSVFWSPRMLLVCLLSFLFSGTVNAQDKTRVSGNIMDENLQPVIGATITVEGTTLGTSSDEGQFQPRGSRLRQTAVQFYRLPDTDGSDRT